MQHLQHRGRPMPVTGLWKKGGIQISDLGFGIEKENVA